MRTTLRHRHHFAYRRFEAVMIAGVVAGFWQVLDGIDEVLRPMGSLLV